MDARIRAAHSPGLVAAAEVRNAPVAENEAPRSRLRPYQCPELEIRCTIGVPGHIIPRADVFHRREESACFSVFAPKADSSPALRDRNDGAAGLGIEE